jgi:hypothetical protein
MVRRRAGAPVPAVDMVAAVGHWMEVWRGAAPPRPRGPAGAGKPEGVCVGAAAALAWGGDSPREGEEVRRLAPRAQLPPPPSPSLPY